MSHCDMAIEILQATSDGNELFQTPEQAVRWGRGDGWQLALVQSAVNNRLNDRGKTLFAALHRQVKAGDFFYPLGEFINRFCPELSGVTPERG